MLRYTLYLTKEQISQLQAIMARTGISVSEQIRKAVDTYIEKMRELKAVSSPSATIKKGGDLNGN